MTRLGEFEPIEEHSEPNNSGVVNPLTEVLFWVIGPIIFSGIAWFLSQRWSSWFFLALGLGFMVLLPLYFYIKSKKS